jgi:hypothetical protein
MSEPSVSGIKWQDSFKDDIRDMNKDSREGFTGWRVDVAWLKEQIGRYEQMKAKAEDFPPVQWP